MEWIDTNKLTPENCKPVYAVTAMRFNHYKPNSQQAKKGIKGRWQEWNGYGWQNCEAPDKWAEQESKQGDASKAMERVKKYSKESDNFNRDLIEDSPNLAGRMAGPEGGK